MAQLKALMLSPTVGFSMAEKIALKKTRHSERSQGVHTEFSFVLVPCGFGD